MTKESKNMKYEQAYQSTPHEELIAQIMSETTPKTEREHAAKREIESLREALAQPEQEPVAWRYNGNLHEFDPSDWATGPVTPLYTTPPQRTWVGLTDEEVFDVWLNEMPAPDKVFYQKLCRSVEAKLKEKNGC